MSFGLPDRFIRLYNLSIFLIRRRISWFIHGKPLRVPAFLVGINLSIFINFSRYCTRSCLTMMAGVDVAHKLLKKKQELEGVFMKHYAPNICLPLKITWKQDAKVRKGA